MPDLTAILYVGRLGAYDITDRLFANPGERQTQDYHTRRHGQSEWQSRAVIDNTYRVSSVQS